MDRRIREPTGRDRLRDSRRDLGCAWRVQARPRGRNHAGDRNATFRLKSNVIYSVTVEHGIQDASPTRNVLATTVGTTFTTVNYTEPAVVSIDEVYQKLKNEVAAAQRLREKYASLRGA